MLQKTPSKELRQRISALDDVHGVVPLPEELSVLRQVVGYKVDYKVQWRRFGPTRVDTSVGAEPLRGQTGREYVVEGGECLKIIIFNLEHGDVISNKLTVLFSSRYSEVRVSDDLHYGQHHVVLLLGVGGGVPLPADHLHVVPSHLRGLGICSAVLTVPAGVWSDVGTTAVGESLPLSRLTEEGAVSAGHQDGGAGGSGQEGDATQVRELLTHRPEGAEPRIAVTGVFHWGD